MCNGMYSEKQREVHIVKAKDTEDRTTVIEIHLFLPQAQSLVDALKAKDEFSGSYNEYTIETKGVVF